MYADDGASHLGFSDPALNKKRAIEEAKLATQEKLNKIEKDIQSAKQEQDKLTKSGRSLDAIARQAEETKRLEKKLADEQAIAKKQIAEARETELIAYLEGTGATGIKQEVIGEKHWPAEQLSHIIRGLGPSQRAFMTGDGRLKIISWEPANIQTAISKKGKTTFLADIDDDIVIDAIKSGAMFPAQFANTRLGETDQNGIRIDHDKGKNIFAEIYQNQKVNMMTVELGIRGDPYWIPNIAQKMQKNKGKGENPSVSPSTNESYCIIIADQANTYKPDTGVMIINKRNALNGVYLVIEATHTFSDGEFSQVLSLTRDPTIELNSVFGGLTISEAAQVKAEQVAEGVDANTSLIEGKRQLDVRDNNRKAAAVGIDTSSM